MFHIENAILIVLIGIVHSKSVNAIPYCWWPGEDCGYCLSWRLAVEANNIRPWRTVPSQCSNQVESYMTTGQYQQDLTLVVDSISTYIDDITLVGDGFDAWILDVDETCISNLFYYKIKRYGSEPYDPWAFKAWASRGECVAIPEVLRLFHKLVYKGYKVFLVSGRDAESLEHATVDNLNNQGFIGYQSLILRNNTYKGQSAIAYKAGIRKQLTGQGYRIWGNVGDQWSDLLGDYAGKHTFKLPNPMYFVP